MHDKNRVTFHVGTNSALSGHVFTQIIPPELVCLLKTAGKE